MKTLGRLTILALFLAASSSASADERGEAAARAGVLAYNAGKPPEKQLPVPSGGGEAVIKGTLQNMGSGMGAKEAFQKAAEKASGAVPATKVK